ncbi:MAG: tetratricopeptide repeat protein, partial [Bacteroidales bacterium]
MLKKAIYITTTIFLLLWLNWKPPELLAANANDLYDSIWLNYEKEDLNNAIKLSKQYLNENKRDDDPFILRKVRIYNLMGYIFYLKYDLTESFKYYELALKYSKNPEFNSIVYGNIANNFLTNGDFAKAIIYYKKALSGIDTNNYVAVSNNYSNLGIAYYKTGLWDKSIEVTRKSIAISENKNPGNTGDKYNTCAIAYLKKKDYQQAEYYFKQAIRHYKAEFGEQHFKTATGIGNYAELLLEKGDVEESYVLVRKSYEILLNTVGKKHPLTSDRLKTIGKICLFRKNYSKALEYFQQALISRAFGFNDTSVYTNPGDHIFVNPDLLDLLKLKAESFEKSFDRSKEEKYLSASLSTLTIAGDYLEDLRIGYLSEDSKLMLTDNEKELYSTGIRVSIKLYELSGDRKFLNSAFQFVEMGKYSVLRELVNSEYIRRQAKLPSGILDKERDLINEINTTRAIIGHENRKEKPDVPSLAGLQEKLFVKTKELENLKDKLESEFPEYYGMKYNTKVSTLTDIQNYLTNDQSILEYVIQNDKIYMFLIKNAAIKLYTESIDTTFHYYLDIYEKVLHSEYSLPYSEYRNSAEYLYRQLILPAENQLKNTKELIIVPDVLLGKISFDALITEDYHENPMKMYQTEPYLIKRYAIGYAFSSSLLVNSQTTSFPVWKSFIGFAPEYGSLPGSPENIPEGYTSIRRIARMFLGRAVIRDKATETKFRKANNCNIISFYTHGVDDTLNPSLSKLYFSRSGDTINDGYLHS